MVTISFFRWQIIIFQKKYINGILEQTQLTVNELIGIIPISIDSYKRNSEFKPPETDNILLYPLHPVYKQTKIIDITDPLEYDARLVQNIKSEG